MNKIYNIVEIALTAILFVAMLVFCGLYINVKMNGKSSSLKPLSEDETALILRTSVSDSENIAGDLLTPLFVGIKNSDVMIAATFDGESRTALNQLANDVIVKLFSNGKSKKIEFDSEKSFNDYVDDIKKSQAYILVSYYDDLNASLFAPCLNGAYSANPKEMLFDVRYIYILPDSFGNVYGTVISSDNSVNVITLEDYIPFNQLSLESYNISEGYAYFDYADVNGIHPVFASSFTADDYMVKPLPELCEIGETSLFANLIFDVFDMTPGLVNSYYTKNDSVMNYVDEAGVITLKDDGYLQFSAEGQGIELNKYLGYLPGESGSFSFDDKITALKMVVGQLEGIVSQLGFDNEARFCLTECVYDKESNILSFGLKSFVNGISVTDNRYDAKISMLNNNLVSLDMYFSVYNKTGTKSLCLPQQYALLTYEGTNSVVKTEDTLYPLLIEKIDEVQEDSIAVESDSDLSPAILKVEWAKRSEENGGAVNGNR